MDLHPEDDYSRSDGYDATHAEEALAILERAHHFAEMVIAAIQSAAVANRLLLDADMLEAMLEGITEPLYDEAEIDWAVSVLKETGTEGGVYVPRREKLCRHVAESIRSAYRVRPVSYSRLLASALKPGGENA
jgi:hypothetical protein